jgi:two-component system chemotaxis response regulator CheY
MSKRILVADDALFMRATLKAILTGNGFEVVGEATNGQEAVELYQSLKPDGVTMDITMPVMDGISAVAKIKEIDPNARIMMVSAMGQKDMVLQAIQAGARDFLIKPFQPDNVVEKVNNLIAA